MLDESRPLGIGLIGAGMVGQRAHLANFVNIPSCRVVALAELRPDLGREAALKYGVERIYPSHRELLADREVKAVVVVTRRPALGEALADLIVDGRSWIQSCCRHSRRASMSYRKSQWRTV